jgi:Ca-activated chloride channel family protein
LSNPLGAGLSVIVFEFAFPWLLALLPAPLLVYRLLPPYRQRARAIRVPFFDQMIQATGLEARPGAVVMSRRWLQVIPMALLWMLLIVGLAKPQFVGAPIERIDAARDVMLAIDLSGSMDYRDFADTQGVKTSRFEAVQRVVDDFVAARTQDRVGLIVFGNRAYLQLPFTRDVVAARSLVELMQVGMAGPRTALGDAIGLAIRSFSESDSDQRLLILLSDGSDTASIMTPVNAAEISRSEGVEIYTIGIGDPEARGEDRVDFETLADIAERTGGQFFNAQDERALGEVYRRIDALDPGEVKIQSWRPRDSLVHWPVGAGLLISLLAALALFFSRKLAKTQ